MELELELFDTLLAVDFGTPCTGGGTFCGICRRPVCQVCCPHHALIQHGVAGDPVEVHLLEGRFPAVTAVRVRHGILGFDWSKIQRIDHSGTSYVMLGREQPDWKNRGYLKGKCSCGDKIQARMVYCSATCKVAEVQQGRGRELIQSLVNSDFSATHLYDRFCTSCGPFSSAFCSDHRHHHDQEEAFVVLTIVRHDGWVLIPAHQLPGLWVSAVKSLITADGTAAVPVHPRSTPRSVGARLCNKCREAVESNERFCSLECKR